MAPYWRCMLVIPYLGMSASPPFSIPRLLTWSLLAASCHSMSLLQEPTPLPPGGVRAAFGVEAGTGGVTPALGLRVGLIPRTELRGKFAPIGGEVGINVQAVDTEHVDLMLMPQYFSYDVDDIFDEEPGTKMRGAGMPAVVSVSLAHGPYVRWQFFLAPDARVGQREGEPWLAAGVHLGAALNTGNDHVSLVPECGVFWGVTGSKRSREVLPLDDAHYLEPGTYALQCGLGVSAGAAHSDATPP